MFKKISDAIDGISKAVVYILAAVEVVEYAKNRFDEINNPKQKEIPVQEAVNANEQ